MKKYVVIFIGVISITLVASRNIGAERPKWDQEKAKETVRQVIALENQGQAWDKIDWETDVDAAVAESQRVDKPIFVYWYVDKGGPADSPC